MLLRQTIRSASVYRAAFAVFGAFCLAAAGWAQTPPAPPPLPAAPLPAPAQEDGETVALQDVLPKARLGRVGIVLAIDAEDQTVTKKDIAGKNVETVSRAVDAFELMAHTFGWITAVGPQTYTELETDFRKANAFADMPPAQAFTLLLGSLDDKQRNTLAGKAGLGIGDMTQPNQKSLFEILLPEQEVSVTRRGAPETEEATSIGILREKPGSVHFRAAQEVIIQCAQKGQDYGRVDVPPPSGDGFPTVYELSSYGAYSNLPKVNGIVIRHDIPNLLKRSDLDYDSPRLQIAVSVKGLKTVKDLIARVAKQTGLELYADPHYEKKLLTWVTKDKDSASASDLLRAVAFCLPATYRRVGTAYVLTESLLGAGTRRQMIQDFEEECNSQRMQVVNDAEKALKENPSQKNLKLKTYDDPFDMTPEQEKMPRNLTSPDGSYDMLEAFSSASLPLEQLTPKQQLAVQKYAAAVKPNDDVTSPGGEDRSNIPDLSKNIHVLKKLAVQMVVSGVNGVVNTDFAAELLPLFRPKLSLPTLTEEQKKSYLDAYKDLPKWTESAKSYASRAIITHPCTTAEVDAALARTEGMGFNQMWMVVFTNGKARIPGTPFPLDKACEGQPDLLAYAIAAGAKTGITVCPVVDVYAWGSETPAELRLRTLRGEDSAQNALRRSKISVQTPSYLSLFEMPAGLIAPEAKKKMPPPSPAIFVDPTNPAVQNSLNGLFKALASYAGAGNWICRDVTPQGFAESQPYYLSSGARLMYDGMGYNAGLRLAFLQKNHYDPIDIHPFSVDLNFRRADTSLTNYEDSDFVEAGYAWNTFRAEALKTTLHSLFTAAFQNCGAKKPNVLFERSETMTALTWYDVWSGGPDTPFPASGLFSFAAPAATGEKTVPPGEQPAIFFLSSAPSGVMSMIPIELSAADWRSVQMKTLEAYKAYRKWDGVVIEE